MSSTFSDPFLAQSSADDPAPLKTSGQVLARALSRAPAAVGKPAMVDSSQAPMAKPFDNLPDGSFAQADPMDAGQKLLLITTDVNPDGSLVIRGEARQAMRQEMRQWVECIRKRGGAATTELRMPTPRDEAIDTLCTRLVERASKAKTKLWSAALPTGRQIVLVSQDVLNATGIDVLVQKLHHKAIQVAMAHGDPYNDRALAMYEAPSPHAGASA